MFLTEIKTSFYTLLLFNQEKERKRERKRYDHIIETYRYHRSDSSG